MNSLLSRLPWWVTSLLGVACAALGAFLVLRPFASLTTLVVVIAVGMFLAGAAALAASKLTQPRWPALVTGTIWIATGVLVLAWPSITTQALAVVVGLALIMTGVLDVIAGIRGDLDERLAGIIGGVASAIFGVLALSWPSVTLLVVAVVFGARLVLFGLRLAWDALRDRHGAGEPRAVKADRPAGRLRRIWHVVGATVALVLAVVLAGVSARINEGQPVVDAFYDTPSEVPDEPGVLLRSEEFTRTIPDNARAWRILYTTTRADGVPAVASGLVVVPTAPASAPRPLIALAHGTTGVARTCAPSVLPDPFAAGAFFALDRVVEEGWALVATDYVGLGTEGPHPYLIGEPSARSVLDSIRAARQLTDASIGDETVVWGHSQGGGAALWTGILAPTYAPDANVIGVAALAPASDLIGLMENLGNVPAGSIFATYVLEAYAAVYGDVDLDDYVRPTARSSFDAAAGRCLAEPAALVSVIGSLAFDMSIFRGDLASGPLLDRLQENIPDGTIEAPLLLGQGEADQLVLPAVQSAFVEARCADGQPIDFRTYPGLDHVPLVEADSPLIPELFDWTNDRLAGTPPTPTCGE
jgi:uncharacterized membrane protein HdeD (DUF308 family)/alpha-beta hydrolase superfamily lysophospholipase